MPVDRNTKVLLVRPLSNRKAMYTLGLDIPLGIVSLAGYLELKRINVQILDLQILKHPYKSLMDTLKTFQPTVAGISSFSVNIGLAQETAKLVKQFDSNIATVIGGVGASALPLPIMENFLSFDYLIYGEGEKTFFELVSALADDKHTLDVPGLLWRQKNRIIVNPARERISDLDNLPFLSFHKLDLQKYSPNYSNYLHKNFVAMVTQRGCPYNCSFCAAKTVWGKDVYYQSGRRIVDEIEQVVHKLRVRDVHFYDDMFTSSRERLLDFCNLLLEKNIKICWNCFSRVDTVDWPLLKLMKKSGCYQIKYGIEAGSQKRLDSVNKGFRLEQAKEAVDLTKRAGIEALATFILGLLGETVEECKETIRFARRLNADMAVFNIFEAIPGSRIFQEIYGKDVNWRRYFQETAYAAGLMPEKTIEAGALEKLTRKAHLSYYFSLAWFRQYLRNIIRRPIRLLRVFNGLKYLFLRILRVHY